MTTARAVFLDRLAKSGQFGFGASSLGNLYRERSDAECRATVEASWRHGVRYFDTAPFYGFGLSERRLGEALGTPARDAFLLSTKVGRLLEPSTVVTERFGFRSPMPFNPVFDYSYDGVMRSVEASLARLGLARIDILYMHDLGKLTHGGAHDFHLRQAVEGGFRAMADLRDQGMVSAIGLGVNETEICALSLEHADFDLFMIAGRYTLLDQSADAFFRACQSRGIGIVAAGIYNSGILATGSSGASAHFDYDAAPSEILRRVAAMEEIGLAFGVPLPAAALQFVAAHPAVTLPVIGTGNADRIEETLTAAQLPIPQEYWDALKAYGLVSATAPTPDLEEIE